MSGIATRQRAVLDAFKAQLAMGKQAQNDKAQNRQAKGTQAIGHHTRNDTVISLTVAEIAAQTGLTRHAAQAGAAGLLRRGLLSRLETGLYALREDPEGNTGKTIEQEPSAPCLRSGPKRSFTGIRRSRRRTMKDRIWQIMRLKPVFTLADLMMVSGSYDTLGSNDKHAEYRRASSNALRFTNYLLQAGLVRKLPHRSPGYMPTSNGYCRYQLLEDLGPKAPVIRQARGTLYDPNNPKHYPLRRS